MRLTNKERAVMKLLAMGLNNKAIGAQLNVSINTVKFHLTNIYKKLEVQNRMQATLRYKNH